MCPRIPRVDTQRSLDTPPRTPPPDWIASARCTTAAFRQHTATRNILCDNCYANHPPLRRNRYEHVIRHYITLGDGSRHEQCTGCSRILVATVPVREATCGECPRILTGFLTYIVQHDLTPYNDSEPTHVVIRQFRF